MTAQHLINNDEFCNRQAFIDHQHDNLWDTVANMDCCGEDDLADLVEFLGLTELDHTAAGLLFGDDLETAELIRSYGEHKLDAMHSRNAGSMPLALHLERECERIYAQLPEQYRW